MEASPLLGMLVLLCFPSGAHQPIASLAWPDVPFGGASTGIPSFPVLLLLVVAQAVYAAMPSSIQHLNSATLSFDQGSSQGMLPSSNVA